MKKKAGTILLLCLMLAITRTGMDWWLKVWVNGKLACVSPDAGGPYQKNGTLFKADVQAGVNTVLVKMAAGANGYGFWLTTLPLEDKPANEISNCSYYAEPLRMNDDPYISCAW